MVNALTEFKLNQNQDPKSQKVVFKFVLELGTTLITPQIRKRSVVGLETPIIQKLEVVLFTNFKKKVIVPLHAGNILTSRMSEKDVTFVAQIKRDLSRKRKKLA